MKKKQIYIALFLTCSWMPMDLHSMTGPDALWKLTGYLHDLYSPQAKPDPVDAHTFYEDPWYKNMKNPFGEDIPSAPKTDIEAHTLFDAIKEGRVSYKSAPSSYQELNKGKKTFNMGPGIGLSQTIYNTAPTIYNPSYMNPMLASLTKDLWRPYAWLKSQEWYALTCIPEIRCNHPGCNKTVTFNNVNQLNEDQKNTLLQNLVENLGQDDNYINPMTGYEPQHPELIPSICPYCMSSSITLHPQTYVQLDGAHQQALAQQIQNLDVHKQSATLPTCRLSIEPADILKHNSREIDPQKLQTLANFIGTLGNPLLFMHHYANPSISPNLFEHKSDIEWFANICVEIIKLCPNVTHVCPISQPLGLAQKISRGMQPPYSITVPFDTYLKNIAEAQKQASIKMKKVNPHLQVLVSHQWKPMKPLHANPADPRHYMEVGITKIADSKYNQAFVQAFKDQTDHFDGVALSIYPALYFNVVIPAGDNCSGALDPHASLEAITKTHGAFGKPIYVVETGCNCPDPQRKKDFIDMILQVCTIADTMKIPVKTCFFWGLTNDINFYREWNRAPGSTHFGFYEKLDPSNPTASITPYGTYFKQVIASVHP